MGQKITQTIPVDLKPGTTVWHSSNFKPPHKGVSQDAQLNADHVFANFKPVVRQKPYTTDELTYLT